MNMFYVKALEYMKSNRALQLWHKMRNDEIEILKDFAVWLDEQSAEHSEQADGLVCACETNNSARPWFLHSLNCPCNTHIKKDVK